jgi:hypothetical protein
MNGRFAAVRISMGFNGHMILANKLQILLCAINDPADRNTSKRRADLQA